MGVESGAEMREAAFYQDEAKERAAAAVKAVEARTSAEVVVAVRRRSGDYRVAAHYFGFGTAAVVTTYMLVAPQVFSIGAMALDAVVAFLLGLLLCRNVEALSRALTPSSTLQKNVATAARAAFFDLGISKTSGRNGILVFVSTFERTCVVLTDVGIDLTALGQGFEAGVGAMQSAVRERNFDAFVNALESLGPVLGEAMPHAEDDVNELPDEVQ